jgi:hypothetical protein
VITTEIKKEFKAKVKHNCWAMYAYCKRDGCCREKWWYPVATWLFLQYKPPPHDCQGEYACSLFTCPESEWSSYFIEYWKNYLKMTIYEFRHGFLNMPKLEGERKVQQQNLGMENKASMLMTQFWVITSLIAQFLMIQ